MRILTFNTWNNRYLSWADPREALRPFFLNGDYDVIDMQELRSDGYPEAITDLLKTGGKGDFTYSRTDDVGIVTRLQGEHGAYTDGVTVSTFQTAAKDGTPATMIGTVHLDWRDESDVRIGQAKALNDWARSQTGPVIVTGDMNAGDVAERGLLSADQQAYFFARTIVDAGDTTTLWSNLMQEYIPAARAREYADYAAAMQAMDANGYAHYANMIQAYFDTHRDEFPGVSNTGEMTWRQWEEIVARDMKAKGLTFTDETTPVADNTPVTMNILKKQFILLQNPSERERYAPHEAGDGSATWTSKYWDSENVWPSWDHTKIDHFLASRPFGKWQVLADDPNDPYTGVLENTGKASNGEGLSDHDPVGHVVKWIGPALSAYKDPAGADRQRLTWGEEAPVFDADGKTFYLTRNNMRTDLYLGQIADDDGNPILTDLSDAEKKMTLDCASADPRFARVIADYCIDDHSFIGETLVTDGGTVIVDEDAALGTSAARLRLDNGGLRIAGTAMTSLDRAVSLEGRGGFIDVADPAAQVTIAQDVSGSGALAKDGRGTLLLRGTKSYTGATTVRGGRAGTRRLDRGLVGGHGR